MDRKSHWDAAFTGRRQETLSWFQDEPAMSLALIRQTGLDHAADIIDVGGGASSLSACLLREGFQNITVLDISPEALSLAQARLGSSAESVKWMEVDVLDGELGSQFSLWHDRAVFHFLTLPEERRAYCQALIKGLRPGGHLIVATFSLDGPSRCSGLDCVRYSPETLSSTLGDEFRLLESATEAHKTPSGATQEFVYCWFRRAGAEEPGPTEA